ncbi:cystatin C (amyloid angiopathy and cerebral hemorrhage) [Nerophis lumbriciformis]|uniref:cystatin C (amyloid angiopathy and cerebral hemorrhage) n=1 Tax=Nerophis lumbriciformis TaxID=546530 RepID=UPI002AE0ABD7|nr:cystatin C (amyloid angiopathy and cerebral hemorrhage) [Nerophis lumbriciformis]
MFWKIAFLVFGAVCAVGFASFVGGFTDGDVNDEHVQNALNYAIVEHNKASNDLYLRQKTEVVKVQQQVVSGMKYKITVRMARTSCRKGGAQEQCEVFQDPEMAKPYVCTFSVWSRPWMHFMQLVDTNC